MARKVPTFQEEGEKGRLTPFGGLGFHFEKQVAEAGRLELRKISNGLRVPGSGEKTTK